MNLTNNIMQIFTNQSILKKKVKIKIISMTRKRGSPKKVRLQAKVQMNLRANWFKNCLTNKSMKFSPTKKKRKVNII
jgi:hypothetical protein